jgi:hypothetical protein
MNAPDTVPVTHPTEINLNQILQDAEIEPVIHQLESELIGSGTGEGAHS